MIRCQVKGCRKESFVVYYGNDICINHWNKHCDEKINLKKVFKIKELRQIIELCPKSQIIDNIDIKRGIKEDLQTSLGGWI